jgi:hypothetical protein
LVVRLDLGLEDLLEDLEESLGLQDPLEDLEESLGLLVHRSLGPQDLEVLRGILN